MISYKPFWRMLDEKQITTYQLIYTYGILPDTIQRLRSGRAVTTDTLNKLCHLLKCTIPDIWEFVYVEDELND